MKGKLCTLVFAALAAVATSQVHAAPVLVTQQPWGDDTDIANMTDVFGSGNFTTYTNYASANVSTIFSASNRFVMLEGGNGSDLTFASYLSANEPAISAWVNGGGALLLQSGGWNTSVTFNGVTLNFSPSYSTANYCGTLTAAGVSAFTTATTQCGNYLAHDVVVGSGLTSFMTGNDNGGSIVAGLDFGSGYIMFSGLTTSQFHTNGPSLVDSIIQYTSLQADNNAVPEPASLTLIGLGLAGIGFSRRKKGAKPKAESI